MDEEAKRIRQNIAKQVLSIKRICRCCKVTMHFTEGVGSGLCSWCVLDQHNDHCICDGYKIQRELQVYDQLEDNMKIVQQTETV